MSDGIEILTRDVLNRKLWGAADILRGTVDAADYKNHVFGLMFLIFFKVFPAVSIWEMAEGRVLEKAQASVVIPLPEPTETKRLRRWSK